MQPRIALQLSTAETAAAAGQFTEILTGLADGRVRVECLCAETTLPVGDQVDGDLDRLLGMARSLRASQLILRLGGPSADQSGGSAPEVWSLAHQNRIFQNCRASVFEAERQDVMLTLEAGPRFGACPALALRSLIDDVNSWVTGVCVNLAAADLAESRGWLTTLRQRVHAVRLGGPPQPGRSGGSPELPAGLEALLADIQFNGPILV